MLPFSMIFIYRRYCTRSSGAAYGVVDDTIRVMQTYRSYVSQLIYFFSVIARAQDDHFVECDDGLSVSCSCVCGVCIYDCSVGFFFFTGIYDNIQIIRVPFMCSLQCCCLEVLRHFIWL